MNSMQALSTGSRNETRSAPVITRRAFLKACGGMGAALALGLSGCGSSAKYGTLSVGFSEEPVTLSPLAYGHVPSANVMCNIYNSLVGLDCKTGQLMPELATEWAKKDEVTWEFKLREGVQFHKRYGELTAEDVEFNVNYTIENNAQRKIAYPFVKGAKATAKYTVEFYLEEPYAPFLFTTVVGIPGLIISKKAFLEAGEQGIGRAPVGTGPFQLKAWEPGKTITLEQNHSYWKSGFPFLAQAVWRVCPDSATRAALLEAGLANLIDRLEYDQMEVFVKSQRYLVLGAEGWNWDCLGFNMVEPPFSAREAREAVAQAVDRHKIVDQVYAGYAVADDDPFPAGFAGLTTKRKYKDTANVSKAKELLGQAGFAQGFDTTFIVLDEATLGNQAEIMATQLAATGITLQVEKLSPEVYQQRRQAGTFGLYLEEHAISAGDPDCALYSYLYSTSEENCGYRNPQLDEWLDKGRALADEAARRDVYAQVLELIYEDVPFVTTRHRQVVRLIDKGVEGFQPAPQDWILLLEQTKRVPIDWTHI